MKMYSDDTFKLQNIAHLKRSLEEAEIIESGMKLVLMDPSLDSMRKGEYEKALTKLNDEIRDLKMMMNYIQKNTFLWDLIVAYREMELTNRSV